MATLLYHSDQNETTTSPFDEAIVLVARSGPVRIVSPYIAVSYLERIIGIAGQWRLISDVQEWLGSLSTVARPRAWQFIRENIGAIHHCPALHAKAVISDSLAMMGSANLTQPGILGRTEMGILVNDTSLVAEMCRWFDRLWVETSSPVVDETSAFIKWLDEEARQRPTQRPRFALSSSSRKVRARLVDVEAPALTLASQQASLNLSAVAQAIIVQDQRRYDSLEQALEAAIDFLTLRGNFTLGELVGEVRKGYPVAILREIYFLLIQHCANHVRSVFAEATHNRLIVADGRFSQSTQEIISAALEPFDAFLRCLISHLSFTDAVGLPSEDQLERETGVSGRDQVLLVSELLDCGWLRLEDVPGELPRYRLDETFEWDGRYKLFVGARTSWAAKFRPVERDKIGAQLVGRARESSPHVERKRDVALSLDQLPEAEVDIDQSFDLEEVEKALRSPGNYRQPLKSGEDRRSESARRQHEYVDSFLAHLLTLVASGQSFRAPSHHELLGTISKVTGTRKSIVEDAIVHIGSNPQVFRLAKDAVLDELILEVNPALSWEMVASYPQTQSVCSRLIGTIGP